MAASGSKGLVSSKAEYLKKYLEPEKEKEKKKRKKKKKLQEGRGMRIVDDDAEEWKREAKQEEVVDEEEDEPVVAEFVDERPDEVKRMEEFRNTNKWRLIQDTGEESPRRNGSPAPGSGACSPEARHNSPNSSPPHRTRHDSPDPSPPRRTRHDSPDPSPPCRDRHDSPDPSPPRRTRHDSPDPSPPRRARHDSPDPSPPRRARHDSPDPSPSRRARHDSPDPSPSRQARRDSPDPSPPRRTRRDSPDPSPPRRDKEKRPGIPKSSQASSSNANSHKLKSYHSDHSRSNSVSNLSPPRKKREELSTQNKRKRALDRNDTDLSPPRRGNRRGSDSDLSPPRRGQRRDSDSDLSPPWQKNRERDRTAISIVKETTSQMLSGGHAGLVSADVLREEMEEQRRNQKNNKHLEDDSKNAQTVFRDKSGKRRDLRTEREEQREKQAEQEKKNQLYAQWSKGLAQKEQQRQNLEDAAKEMDKPLARYINDTDLDKMLREQDREGDPMAKFLIKKKEKEGKDKKVRPTYKGPNPPPNRFNILPGYRWDGVDRSNGFEKQRFARLSEKKAVQDAAYKWSVEDM